MSTESTATPVATVVLSPSRKVKIAALRDSIARYDRLKAKAIEEIERLETAPTNGPVSDFTKEERKVIVDAVLAIEKDEEVSFKIGVNRYINRNSDDPRSEKLDVNTVGDWKRKIYPSTRANASSTTTAPSSE
jgi:hypothetical protein